MSFYNKNIKCVILGDDGSGKKTLLFSYISKKPELENHPSVYKPPTTQLEVGKYRINLVLCDTKGHDKYDQIRPLCYPDTDVFVICFSLIDGTTFNRVRTKWQEEVKRYSKNDIPILLVGTKLDLRDDKKSDMCDKNNRENIVTEQPQYVEKIFFQDGTSMAEIIGAEKYIECSALDNKSMEGVFEAAVNMVLSRASLYTKKRKKLCC